ncbi:hypothetical protein [Mycolicibacterium neoaurum]|uniref:hypothetical protein n=1 Tax=Mycolicibacterium neoaurum TaxID=1795 RepID=UPI001F4CD769|nr:hypothetical protein [Mycolicibacterium neoaurum]
MAVDHDMLRGSGRPIPQPVTRAAGVNPGQRLTFTGPSGELTLVWRLSSTTGGSVGSMRSHARAVDAVKGDDLVPILRTDTASFDVIRIASDESAWSRLPKLLGRAFGDNTSRELARSLDCTPEQVDDVLRSPGDRELLALLENDILARR